MGRFYTTSILAVAGGVESSHVKYRRAKWGGILPVTFDLTQDPPMSIQAQWQEFTGAL